MMPDLQQPSWAICEDGSLALGWRVSQGEVWVFNKFMAPASITLDYTHFQIVFA